MIVAPPDCVATAKIGALWKALWVATPHEGYGPVGLNMGAVASKCFDLENVSRIHGWLAFRYQ
jgi:hypothetical protein